MPLYRHQIHSQLIEYIQNPEGILVLEGVRQTGKTTSLHQALEGKNPIFITLTDETIPVIALREAQTFEDFCGHLKNSFGFIPQEKRPLVIDEAQKSPTLHKFLLKIHADWKGTPIILSGSAMGIFFKRAEIQKTVSPAGRIKRLVMRPFSFKEYLDLIQEKELLDIIQNFTFEKKILAAFHERLMNLFYRYLMTGGFPESLKKSSSESVYDYLETLLSFFWQDADRYLSELTGSNKRQYGSLFRTVLENTARLTGSPSTRASLLSTDSPAYRTDLPILLDAAEEWHFLFRLPTEMKSFTTKRGHNSKKYLWDVGVANHFLNVGRPVGPTSPPELLGKLLESFVAQELIHSLESRDRLFSWKSQNRQPKELDFLARFPKQDAGVEVKGSQSFNQKAISQLIEFQKANPQAPGYVVYLGMPHQSKELKLIPPYLAGEIGRDL